MYRISSIVFVTIAIMLAQSAFAQVTYNSNDPNLNLPVGFLGWDQPGADLDIRTTNQTRMKILQSTGPMTINGQSTDLSGHVAIGQDVTSVYLPLSPIHIFGSAPPLNAAATIPSSVQRPCRRTLMIHAHPLQCSRSARPLDSVV